MESFSFCLNFPEARFLLTGRKANSLQDTEKAINSPNFERSLTSLTGEDKSLFLAFVGRMLKWMPEDRATAGELLGDPWLKS